ncbi:MAG: peptidase M56 [Patescibacteria group bacterium]
MEDSRNKGGVSETRIWLVLLGIIALFTIIVFYTRHVTIVRQENQANIPVIAHYTNYAYGINLRFPPDWKAVGGQVYDRYEGESGFFSVGALGTSKTSIDELVESEINQKLKPYGNLPSTKKLVIDGGDARLILPSTGQDASMREQAELVVEYPEPKNVGSTSYKFFVLWADRANIENIASTITFVR